tara:strand:+ start:161 stop:319 length:159 start_codon:yes stop_codon:yes gene_type:complete
MGKHLDYVQQSDGTYKWELAEIPAVKSTPAEAKPKTETKKVSNKKTNSALSE